MTDWQPKQETPSQGTTETPDSGAETQAIARELKRLGTVLAAAVRAAATTPEAESLKSELRTGSQAMMREIDDATAGPRAAASRAAAPYRTSGSQKLRTEVSNTLRALNRSLENLATAIEREEEQRGAGDTGPTEPQGGPGGPPTTGQ